MNYKRNEINSTRSLETYYIIITFFSIKNVVTTYNSNQLLSTIFFQNEFIRKSRHYFNEISQAEVNGSKTKYVYSS